MPQVSRIFEKGLRIQNTATAYEKEITIVVGVPDGTGALADYAIGSEVTDESTGHVYRKYADNGNAADWVRTSTQADIDAINNRLPRSAVVLSTATSLPTGTPTQTITVDSTVISDGEAVFFPDVEGAANIHFYEQSSGTFIEDTENAESAADTVFIEAGTKAGYTYTYNASSLSWQITAAVGSEQGYQNAYMGKTDGNNLPQYSALATVIYIADDDPLTLAATKLDAAIVDLSNTVNDISPSFTAADVTTVTVVDSIYVDDFRGCTWDVAVSNTAETAFTTAKVTAMHNGTALADATGTPVLSVDKLDIGVIAGLTFGVTLSGTGNTQLMDLTVTSTDETQVKVVRRAI